MGGRRSSRSTSWRGPWTTSRCRCSASVLQGGAEVGGERGRRRASAATRSPIPSRSTAWSCSASSIRTGCCATRRARSPATPVPHEAARARHDLHGGQARRRDSPSSSRAARRRHDDAEPRRRRGHARGRRRGRDRRHRVRPARPPPRDAARRAGSRRASTPAPCRCSPACSTWRAAASSRAARRRTTPSWRRTSTGASCTEPEQLLLADAQTSGGLLIATGRPGRAGVRRSQPRDRVRRDRRRSSTGAAAHVGSTGRLAGITDPAASICTCNGGRDGDARAAPIERTD